MWVIAFDFLKRFWKPLICVLLLCAIPFAVSAYNSRLINKGRAEVQAVFDKYKADQAEAAKKAQDELNAKAKALQLAEAEAAQKTEQIKQMTAKELDYEVRTKVVYRNCKLPQSGVQLYKRAAERR